MADITREELDKIIHRLRCDRHLVSGDIDALEHAARRGLEADALQTAAREALEPFVRYADAVGIDDDFDGEVGEQIVDGIRRSLSYRAFRRAHAIKDQLDLPDESKAIRRMIEMAVTQKGKKR